LQTVNPNSGVSFGATPDTAAGGVCSGKSSIAYQFVGVMNHQFLFLLGQRFSKPHCAFLVNLCEPSAQGCSCDGYIRPGGNMKALRILPGEHRIEEIELPDDQGAVAEAIQKALGGGTVKLPDFFDGLPNGDALLIDFQYNTAPSEVRSRHPLPTKPP